MSNLKFGKLKILIFDSVMINYLKMIMKDGDYDMISIIVAVAAIGNLIIPINTDHSKLIAFKRIITKQLDYS